MSSCSPEAWAQYLHFRPLLAQAVDERLYPLDWLDLEVAEGRALFWCTSDAAILAEIKTYPSGLYDLHGLLAAGNMRSIVGTLIPMAERWAAEVGCDGALIQSRAGWQRILGKSGYEPHQVSLRKSLTG
jgi:hypothetical protein